MFEKNKNQSTFFYQTLREEGELIDDALEESFYFRRLDAGLFMLQLVVCVIMEACSSGISSVRTSTLHLYDIYYERTESMKMEHVAEMFFMRAQKCLNRWPQLPQLGTVAWRASEE